ncbi:MAG: LacI family DNA-binding transcriptional regulator [Acholeplasmataceae bacterium]|jgi:DNA-binding LacI/PurR family transcriptional regulator
MATSRDVAKIAGVSHATVCRVFSEPESVSEKTKILVHKAAKKLNYVPNSLASSLKKTNANTVGVVISNIRNSFFTNIAYGLQKNLNKKNINLLINFSNENISEEKECIKLHLSYRTSIILFTPSTYDDKVEEMLRLSTKVRFIQLFRKGYENIDSIVVDDYEGTRKLTKLFIENGHKKILLLDGMCDIPTHRDKGYIDAFIEEGIEVDEQFLVSLSLNEPNHDEIQRLIKVLKPTAIIAVSEIITSEVVEVLNCNNIEIGKDISLAVYDDSFTAKALQLTAIGHDKELIETSIIKKINKIMENDMTEHFHLKIEPVLIERKSIKKLK